MQSLRLDQDDDEDNHYDPFTLKLTTGEEVSNCLVLEKDWLLSFVWPAKFSIYHF